MNFSKSTILITGGASGLGRSCAERFVRNGANVVIADVNAVAGGEQATSLGPRSVFVATDVTDEGSVSAALALAQARFGGLQGVVHCAGILGAARVVGKSGPHDLGLFRRLIEVNLIGTFNVLRLAAAAMSQQPAGVDGERGVLIATSSIAAEDGQIGQAAYAAAKAGVAGLVLPLARELAKFGIRVNAIAPGVFDTQMMAGTTAGLRESLASQIPFPARFGQADEFAALAQHILENGYLNGAIIRLDGAMRMGAQQPSLNSPNIDAETARQESQPRFEPGFMPVANMAVMSFKTLTHPKNDSTTRSA